MKRFSLGLVACSFLAVAAACGSSSTASSSPDGGADSGDLCPPTGKGTLTVKVSGLPDGVKAKVTLEGPSGTQEIEAPATLSVPGGAYGATGAAVTTPDPIVRSVFKALAVGTGTTCVSDGATASVEVKYTLVPSSNKLWTTAGNGDAELVAFASSKLTASATQTPDVSIQLEIPGATAFDRDGGLWAVVGSAGGRALAHYPADILGASGDKTADITITIPNDGIPAVGGIALDSAGNLWFAAPTAGKVHRIAAADLRVTGTPTSLLTISGLTSPNALAFDASGDLWIAEAGKSDVVEFVAGRLNASTAAAPDVVLTAQTPSPVVGPLTAPSGVAFDATGNMWVDFNDTIVRFTAAERVATTLLTPGVQITLNVAALSENLAFDESGGLWFSYSVTKIGRLSPAQLGTSGKVDPATIVTDATLGSASQIALYPAAAALPLFGKPR